MLYAQRSPDCYLRGQIDGCKNTGTLRVSAEPPLGDPAQTFVVRVCTACFNDTVDGLRGDGYRPILITAPEQPKPVPWRG